jgi:integrase
MAKPYRRKGSRFWWIAPTIRGVQVPQSSGETDHALAERKLKILEGKIASNSAITPRTDRGSFAALLEPVKTDYKIKRRRSEEDLIRRIDKHLVPALGHLPAGKITSTVIADYVLDRQRGKHPAANATINRELAIIKRAYHLGQRSGAVSAVPYIEMLPEDNARQGFFSDESFRSVLAHANETLKAAMIVAYYTGWRINSILNLEWRQVDLKAGIIRLPSQQTKNRKATVFPLSPFQELRDVLEALQTSTKEIEKQKAAIVPYVFHRNGIRVRSIRTAWNVAKTNAGFPGKLIHDFRRTAVRNLKRYGFSDTDIMQMVGFKTLSIMHRYNITTEEDILAKADLIAKRVLQ